MPDYGLTEALARALKASKGLEIMRPAEQKLAAAAAKTAPAAPSVPDVAPARVPSVEAPPAEAPPGSVQQPQLNPSVPPEDIAAPAPPDPAVATPAPTDVAAGAADAVPVDPAAVAPEAPVAPAPARVDPEAIAPTDKQPVIPEAPEAPALTDVQASAHRFVDANMGDFKGKLNQTHMPNTDVMDVPENLKAGILQVAEDNKDAIEEARRGTITDEQLTGLAQDIAASTDVVRQVLSREFGAQAERPEVILAARMVEQQQLGTIAGLAEKIADGSATSAEIVQYEKAKGVFGQYVAQLMGAKAEQGRGLRALGINVGDTPQPVIDHVANVLKQNNPDMQAEAAAIKMAMSPGGIAHIVNGMAELPLRRRIGKATFNFVQRMFINGILWGPQTWAKIFVGNNFNLAMNSMDLFAAGIGRGMVGLAARIGGYPTAVEGVTMSDAFAHIHGVVSGGADALRVAGRVMRTGVSLDAVNGVRAAEGATIGQRGSIYTSLPELQGTYFGAIAHGVDQVFSASGERIINGIDEFTKTLGYRGYLQMMQLKELRARLAEGTVKPGDAESVMQDLMANPSPEMQQAAEAWAHRMTFQTPFPEGGPGEAFQSFLNRAPVLRFIFTFMRTATNIFKQSITERTPLAIFSARIRGQIAAGGFEGDLAKSRIATGTAIMSMFAWMAIHDRITGPAPDDPKERAEWALDGRTPYSMRVTDPITGKDSWHDYSWMEPVSSIAGIIADVVKTHAYIAGEDETLMPQEDRLKDVVSHIAASVITNTANKTFMMSAAQAAEAYNSPTRALSMWADQIAASTVPMSGLTKFVRNEQDPYMRQANDLLSKIKNEMPTVMGINGSKTLQPNLDLFGEPRVHKGGNALLGPLNPFPGSPSTKDALSDEIQSVMEQTRVVPITMPSKQISLPDSGSGRGIQQGQGMRMTPEEYNDFVVKARAEPIFDGGKLTFREKLEQTIALPVYQKASPAMRVELLASVQRKADELGRQALMKDNPEFAARLQAWAQEKNRIRLGQ